MVLSSSPQAGGRDRAKTRLARARRFPGSGMSEVRSLTSYVLVPFRRCATAPVGHRHGVARADRWALLFSALGGNRSPRTTMSGSFRPGL